MKTEPSLEAICPDVWGYEQQLKLPGGLAMPGRMTIVRREDGGLILHSPVSIDDAVAREISELGEVRALVAPSCIHYIHLQAAMKRFPKAEVLGAPGLEKKLAGVKFAPLPASGSLEALGDGLRVRRVEGVPSITEHVFFHEASRSLIVTDFLFNLHRCPNLPMRFFLWLGGVWKRPGQSKLWRFSTKDRDAAAASVADILAWDFDRVVVAHGDILEASARDHVRAAASWMLRGSPPLLGARST